MIKVGGGRYHSDVQQAQQELRTVRRSDDAFAYSERASRDKTLGLHADLNICKKIRECCDSSEHPESTPIVVAMDVTRSRGDDGKRVYAQVPAFLGALTLSQVVPDPMIMWAAIGDANCDRAPIQVGQFESDRRIDEYLKKIWLEEGGGGSGEESYELLAYYLAHKTSLDANRRGKKGFLFFTADEAPYPTLSRSFVRSYIGDDLKQDIPTQQVFKDLREKYDPFLIFPRASMQERVVAIDAEIRQRLEKAGGRFKDVDIRASLIWNDRNDLDLHCKTPAGDHIFYAAKRAYCGGELDVDRNVRGEDPKPVENTRWAKGDAKRGHYEFWVELYAYHEHIHADVPFKVEVEINGEIQTFEGIVPKGATHQKVVVHEFNYAPLQSDTIERDNHAAYQDDVILDKWSSYIPPTQILRVDNPDSVVEVMLGVLAIKTGKSDLDGFISNMKQRDVPAERQQDVIAALSNFANHGVFHEVADQLFAQ